MRRSSRAAGRSRTAAERVSPSAPRSRGSRRACAASAWDRSRARPCCKPCSASARSCLGASRRRRRTGLHRRDSEHPWRCFSQCRDPGPRRSGPLAPAYCTFLGVLEGWVTRDHGRGPLAASPAETSPHRVVRTAATTRSRTTTATIVQSRRRSSAGSAGASAGAFFFFGFSTAGAGFFTGRGGGRRVPARAEPTGASHASPRDRRHRGGSRSDRHGRGRRHRGVGSGPRQRLEATRLACLAAGEEPLEERGDLPCARRRRGRTRRDRCASLRRSRNARRDRDGAHAR